VQWFNEPPQWEEKDGKIAVTSGAKTDFWRKTRHGFIKNDGNFYHREVDGDFVASVKITGEYKAQYDQAGLMVTLDDFTWMKCGVEFVDSIQQASVVVTRDYSDWSVLPMFSNPESSWIKVERFGEAFVVSFSRDGENYFLLREAFLTAELKLLVGVMVASPKGDGFKTTFEELNIEPTAEKSE